MMSMAINLLIIFKPYGPIITGHAHPHITKAIQEQAAKGVLFGTPTELEIEFSKNYVMQFHLLRKFAL